MRTGQTGSRDTPPDVQASQPAKQSGTPLADTIRASGQHERPHRQAGHKTAPDQRVRSSIRHLQCGSHPHRTCGWINRSATEGDEVSVATLKDRLGAGAVEAASSNDGVLVDATQEG